MSSEIYKEAKNLINRSEVSHRHTFFQLKHFVLGKELTTQAKMQKCLKETEARVESITAINLSIEETKDDINIIDLKILNLGKKKVKNDINKQYKEIQIRKLNRKKTNRKNNNNNNSNNNNKQQQQQQQPRQHSQGSVF